MEQDTCFSGGHHRQTAVSSWQPPCMPCSMVLRQPLREKPAQTHGARLNVIDPATPHTLQALLDLRCRVSNGVFPQQHNSRSVRTFFLSANPRNTPQISVPSVPSVPHSEIAFAYPSLREGR